MADYIMNIVNYFGNDATFDVLITRPDFIDRLQIFLNDQDTNVQL
jgi:hypothetical protein